MMVSYFLFMSGYSNLLDRVLFLGLTSHPDERRCPNGQSRPGCRHISPIPTHDAVDFPFCRNPYLCYPDSHQRYIQFQECRSKKAEHTLHSHSTRCSRAYSLCTCVIIQFVLSCETYALALLDVAISYAINALILGYVWWNWKAMIKLRTQWFRSDEYNKSFYARTLMVLNVPKNIRSDDGLRSLLGSLQMPYPTTSVHIGRQVGQLPELIEYHNDTVRSFEKVLVRYLKGGKIGSKRPTIRIGGFMGFGGEKKVRL